MHILSPLHLLFKYSKDFLEIYYYFRRRTDIVKTTCLVRKLDRRGDNSRRVGGLAKTNDVTCLSGLFNLIFEGVRRLIGQHKPLGLRSCRRIWTATPALSIEPDLA